MTPMHWEPMTEDAVFVQSRRYLVVTRYGHCETSFYDSEEDKFYSRFGLGWTRSEITHFARITNPNEVMP